MSDSEPSLPTKLARLRSIVREMGSALVCYSGGIDSALVLAIAHEQLGRQSIGMTAVSPSLSAAEQQDAAHIARQLGAEHRFVETAEMELAEYTRNAPDRCFHCRSVLYQVAHRKRVEWNLGEVLNGTNADDFADYRPGLKAAKQANIRSPLVEAGLGKANVREAARMLGMPVWDKPAAACLSSRIPYGTSITPERLAQVGGFEADLRALGFGQLRVRWHGSVARLEFDLAELGRALDADIRSQIVLAGKRHGFKYVAVDLAGYRTGSHNEVLDGRQLRVI